MFRLKYREAFPKLGKRKYRCYSPTMLHKAYLDVVDKKFTVCKAARRYGVPEQTLRDREKGKVKPETVRSGPAPLLSLEEEARLVDHIKQMGAVGYGYTRAEGINLVSEFAVQLGKRD